LFFYRAPAAVSGAFERRAIMKRLFVIFLAGFLVLGALSASAGADSTVKVWTQNLYIGADLTPVLDADTPSDFFDAATGALTQMGANLFPIRAQRLATEIALYEPDLIALQEVEDISVNGTHPGPPFVDYLQALLNALALRGQNYTVAAVVLNLDLQVPIDLTGDDVPELVRVVDRDVILVREGVGFSLLTGDYTTGGLCGVPVENPAYPQLGPQYFDSTPSLDGCNYTIVATAPTPLPPPAPASINIERGFVGIDATVRGKTYRFVNTHLEQRALTPEKPESAIFQSLQAAELVGTLLALTPPDRKLILIGDFNSSREDAGFDGIRPPYQIITNPGQGIVGFTDAWTRNPLALLDPKGYTCCQDADLANRQSALYERIDIVFIRNARFTPWEFVTTKVPLIFPEPHWASDHGGVFAKIVFK
jgi:endonuclease/exonuclease/phosphatase family metal-dependent hydrolase